MGKKYTANELKEVADSLENFEFGIVEANAEVMSKAVEKSLAYNISIYDAAYVAVAELSEATLYTADLKMLDKVKEQFVKDIKNYK